MGSDWWVLGLLGSQPCLGGSSSLSSPWGSWIPMQTKIAEGRKEVCKLILVWFYSLIIKCEWNKNINQGLSVAFGSFIAGLRVQLIQGVLWLLKSPLFGGSVGDILIEWRSLTLPGSCFFILLFSLDHFELWLHLVDYALTIDFSFAFTVTTVWTHMVVDTLFSHLDILST